MRLPGAAVLLVLAAVAGCQPDAPPPVPAKSNELVVAVRPGPTSWYPGPDGQPAGFDHDLIAGFAAEHGLELRIVEADHASDLLTKVRSGEVQIGAGGLYLPLPAAAAAAVAGPAPETQWTTGYFAVEPVLIYGSAGYRPRDWRDLAGATVAYLEDTGVEPMLAVVRAAHPEVQWKSLALPSADSLVAQIAEGRLDYAVVPSVDAAAARNIFLGFDVAFTVGPKRDLGWAVAPGKTTLLESINAYFAAARRDGRLARYADRYFNHARQVERIDAGVFQERVRSLLPDYRKMFEDAQLVTGVEWRLLAAVAYQESHWNPFATSETGVRGIMQITEETGKRLGIGDRLDPQASILGAARYLRDLKAALPARIGEPDRTWLALAAFNIGLGHLEDARILAQRQKLNPDLWLDVKTALPLLALPEYYRDARLGYARGGMPVVFVDRVRAYYDILLRQESATVPRLRQVPAADRP